MFADRTITRRLKRGHFEVFAFNDNELEADLPTVRNCSTCAGASPRRAASCPAPFDLDGQAVAAAIVRRCLDRGWAAPWISNPLKPDWLVCKLTEAGRRLATP